MAKAQQAMARAADAIASSTKPVDTAFSSTAKNSQKLGDAVDDLGDSAKEMGDSFGKASKETEKMSPPLDDTEKSSQKVLNAFEKLVVAVDEQADQLTKLKTQYAAVVLEQGKDSDEAKKLASEIEKLSGELANNKNKLNEAASAADKYDKSIDEAKNGTSTFAQILKANLTGEMIVGGIKKIASAMKEITVSSVEAAAAVRAENSTFEQTFGSMADAASEAIGRVADESGILQTRLNSVGTQIYAFARSSGGSATDSLNLMERALKVAADSAAYYDRSLEDTADSLQSFLKGNYANDAALGVSATETTRNAAAMELFGEKFQNLSEIQKQETLLKMVEDVQELSGAIGQASREADGWENVIGNLQEAWRQLQSKIGEPILDTVTPIIKGMSDGIQMVTENWEDVKVAAGLALAQVVLFGGASATIGLLTGSIKKAEAAQKLLNLAMAKSPILIIATAITAFGVAAYNAFSETQEAVDSLTDSLVTEYETQEEATAAAEEFRAKMKEIEDTHLSDWSAEVQVEYEGYRQAAEQAEAAAENFGKAVEETADTAEDAAAKAAEEAEALAQEYADAYESVMGKLYNIGDAMGGVAKVITVSYKDMMTNVTDAIKANDDYAANWDYVAECAENAGINLDDVFQVMTEMPQNQAAGYIAGLATELQNANGDAEKMTQTLTDFRGALDKFTTSQEGIGERYVEATTGMKQVGDAATATAEGIQKSAEVVTTTQEELSQTVELNNETISQVSKDMVTTWEDAVKGLDKGAEAKTAAENTMQKFIDGMNAKIPSIVSTAQSIGRQIASALQSGVGTITIPMNASVSGNIPGYAKGLDYVPYDNYLAYLHKGEAVLTASEASAWRVGKDSADGGSSGGSGTINITQNIESVPQTPVELAAITAAYFEQARWAM